MDRYNIDFIADYCVISVQIECANIEEAPELASSLLSQEYEIYVDDIANQIEVERMR
jgi:hypothetical protein